MPGTLYLLRSNADASLHKIGITNHWHQRAKQLEVGLSTACVGRWMVNDSRQLERFLHRRFKAHRLPQSEWFHLTPDQVQWVVSAASKAADDLKQATNHQQATQLPRPPAQPPYGVWGRQSSNGYQPAQPATAHASQRQPAPYRSAGQAKPEQVLTECLLNLAGMGIAGLALMGLASAINHPAQSPYYRPAGISSPTAGLSAEPFLASLRSRK
jgi:hypothetical protein